jgi:cytochrome c peroxidase
MSRCLRWLVSALFSLPAAILPTSSAQSQATTTWHLACGDEPPPQLSGRYSTGAHGDMPPIDELVALGRQIFFDQGLSASGRQSCASCHDPAHAFGPTNAQAVQRGGATMRDMGLRAAPSLRYVHAPLNFTEHHIDLAEHPEGPGGPAGGRTWDGRVNDARQQALMPLLDPHEMANRSLSEVVQRLRRAPYAKAFDQLLSPPGTHILDDEDGAVSWLTTAIMFFEQSAEDFHPFTSKYDAYLLGRAPLSPAELRGVRLFTNPQKGNCASCHPVDAISPSVPYPRFTDFEFSALGVPRNTALPANRNPAFHDLGLCGPLRKDLADHPGYCGLFRAPTLRNAARKQVFFHNGVFHSLQAVMDFYATRETDPARWYGRDAQGHPRRYNDLPAAFHRNVKQDAPFTPLPNGQPRLSRPDRADLIAFLKTLNDGFVPPPVPLLMLPDDTPADDTAIGASGPQSRWRSIAPARADKSACNGLSQNLFTVAGF